MLGIVSVCFLLCTNKVTLTKLIVIQPKYGHFHAHYGLVGGYF